MAITRYAHDSVMDGALDVVATSTVLRVCSGVNNPADLSAAIAATLAESTLTAGDFTKANGTSGRKTTVGTQPNLNIDVGGNATCVTLDNGVTLLYVVPATQQTLNQGGSVTVPDFDITIADPTAP